MFSLTIEDNNGQIAEQFSFDHGSYLIGRQENCDIVLPSSRVSRKHAKIFVEKGRCYVEDLNSANGVSVDGQRVANQRDLGTASQIKIGDYYLYLEYQGEGTLSDREGRDTLFIADGADHNKLVRVNDEFAGEEFSLSETENTIGRTDDNFILLSDPSISREHAVVTRDGDRYILEDRGSSNGTRVDGREVTAPVELEPGQVVEFGNVQFVFARGDQTIDPSEYATSDFGTGTLLLASVVAVVVLVGVVAGVLVVFGFWSYRDGTTTQASAAQSARNVDRLVDEGKRHLENQEWHKAVETFNEILANSPEHERAKSLRDRARRERKARQYLNQGIEFSENGEHAKALDTLEKIPKETAAFEEAKPTLDHVRKTLAFKFRTQAKEALRSGGDEDIAKAYDKLRRAAQLAPEGSKVQAKMQSAVEKLETKMKERGIPRGSD